MSSNKLLIIYTEMRIAMKIRTNIKAGNGPGSGSSTTNHNEKLMSDKDSKSLLVKTGVKAGIGPTGTNHNEKLTSDNNRSIDQKKSIGKKLRLSKETIRELKDGDLRKVAGGRPPESGSCNCIPTTTV